MSTASVELRVFPGKEMMAIDMAEALDAAMIYSGIVQGCTIHYESQKLSIDSGRIIIKGRIGVVTGGDLDEYPELSSETSCKLLAVCDLSADTPFYLRYFTTAEFEALRAAAENISDFNAGNGIAWVTLGTAKINPATQRVTEWTPGAAATTRNTDLTAYQALQQTVNDNQTAINASLDRWVTYLQQRLHSANYYVTADEIVIPAVRLSAGQARSVGCKAIRGNVLTATAVDTWTESPPSIPSYNPTPVEGVPTVIDNAAARYIAKGFTGIYFANSTFVPRGASQAAGKNADTCVLRGFNISGTEGARTGYVYVKNIGAAEAVIDIHVFFLFVRRG